MKDQLALSQRFGLFLLGLVYGFFGSPSPNSLGLVELAVFVLLVFSIGIKGFTLPTIYLGRRPPHASLIASPVFWLLLLFIWGTVASLIIGLIIGNTLPWIARDYASFLLLCLPLFFVAYMDSPQFQKILIMVIAGIGGLFSLRVIQNLYAGSAVSDTGSAQSLYLSISPEILFTSCFMLLCVIKHLFLGQQKQSIYQKTFLLFGFCVLTFITSYIFYANSMRAGVGALILSTFTFFIWMLIYRPKRALVFLFICLVVFLPYQDVISVRVIDPLIQKQQLVGLSQRMEELDAVSHQHGGSLLSHIFGKGWGAGIESPSSAGLLVNFTHNLFSSLWLKTGFVGCFIMAMFFISIFVKLFRTIPISDHFLVTLLIPLVLCIFINLLLYGGYKSLGFGLCLTLLLSTCYVGQKTHKSIAQTP